jgi:hypothetical protein
MFRLSKRGHLQLAYNETTGQLTPEYEAGVRTIRQRRSVKMKKVASILLSLPRRILCGRSTVTQCNVVFVAELLRH